MKVFATRAISASPALAKVPGLLALGMLCCVLTSAVVSAQTMPPDINPVCEERGPMRFPLQFDSTTRMPDGRILFRMCAPNAADVRVVSSDIASLPNGMDKTPAGLPMARDSQGYWAAKTPVPVGPGTYRFSFKVDGVVLPDPQSTALSQGWRGATSVLEVPGAAADFYAFDPRIEHGLVSTLVYTSTTLKGTRRAHVYTPPGYESGGNRRYPVLYLVHGAGDSDDSWTSAGHANLILDTLIASAKAMPMIVVMPFGHTPLTPGKDQFYDTDFGGDLLDDLVPYIDRHFRTEKTADKRAMAGLSMGGAHTLAFGLPHPEVFGQIGVFSMGFYLPGQDKTYTDLHDAQLKRRAATTTKPVFFAMGKADFLYGAVGPTRKMMDDYAIRYTYHESEGGHSWENWRAYLAVFAPTLFR